MKTCFIALDLFLTSYLIVPYSLYSFKLKWHYIHIFVRVSEHCSEPRLSLQVCLPATPCVLGYVTCELFLWWTLHSAFVSQGMDGISQQWSKVEVSKLLFTDKFIIIPKYKLFLFTWEIQDVIFYSGFSLFLSLSPKSSISLQAK